MRHLLLVPVVLFTLAGCGNKGALYLPEPKAEPTPATTADSAAKPGRFSPRDRAAACSPKAQFQTARRAPKIRCSVAAWAGVGRSRTR